MNRSTIRRWMWRLLGLLGFGFMFAVVRRELSSGAVIAWPDWKALVSALVLVGLGLWLSSTAWVRLLGGANRAVHRADFFAAQLGKYLPGGIWQPLGQVGLSSERGIAKGKTSAAVVAHAGIQVAAGIFIASALAFRADLSVPLRWIAAVCFLVPLLLAGAMKAIESWRHPPARLRRVRFPTNTWPTFVLLLLNLLLQGVAFALVASTRPSDLAWSVIAFAVAWTVGFLAIPFPAGLGVREAVLIAMAPVPGATVIAASVVLRLVTIGVEFVAIIATRIRS